MAQPVKRNSVVKDKPNGKGLTAMKPLFGNLFERHDPRDVKQLPEVRLNQSMPARISRRHYSFYCRASGF